LRGLQSAIETRVDDRAPSLDQAGRRIAWVADRGDRRIVYWRDLPNGRDNWLQLEPRLIDDPVLSPEGQRVIVRAFEPARQALWLADLRTGRARKVLADAGPPLEWSRDGRFVFYEPAGTPRATVARLDLMTGRAQVVLEHPEHGVRGVRVSPDAAWVAFHVEIAPGRRQIYLASNSGPVAVEEWRPVTPGLDLDFNPAWTADGKRILFLSNRDGHLCLWAQPVDLSRGEPVEDSFAVEHLHAAGRSIRLRAGVPYRTLGPVARRNQVYLSVEQWRSNIWSLRVP
jgi:Tol biopolymer transport system component